MTEDQIASVYTDQGSYGQMLAASLVHAGNNARLKKFLARARSGAPLKIGAIGGSITEGAGAETFFRGYAYQFAQAVAQVYCGGDSGQVRLVNGGLGGTPSSLGIMRYRRDVLDGFQGEPPDLLLIEFSVNDHAECTGGRAYEALVLDALGVSADTAVILVFSVFPGLKNLQDIHIPVGKRHHLPMVSVKDAIAEPYGSGRMQDKDYFADIYHPVTIGHTLMADCLMHLLRRSDEAPADEPVPAHAEALYGSEFCGTVLLTAGNPLPGIRSGGFCGVDTQIQSFVTLKRPCFPDNWHYGPDTGDSGPFQLELACKNLLLAYKLSKSESYGTAEVIVDGRKAADINACSPEGWNNIKVALVLDDRNCAKHTIEVRMAAGCEDKEFTLLALGNAV